MQVRDAHTPVDTRPGAAVTPPEASGGSSPRGLAAVIASILGTSDLPVAIECFDGSRVGPRSSPATIVIERPDAIRRLLTAPGELGFSRAYVAGDIDIRGDIFAALEMRRIVPDVRLQPKDWAALLGFIGWQGLRPIAPPPEEIRLRGRRHTRNRDRAAISYHYDVSNDFYRLFLGESMTYSCAVFHNHDATLEEAQYEKYDLVCRKLGLRPGMRLLDVGCGWGGMVRHAAKHYGVHAVGVTVSDAQAEWGQRVTAEMGLSDQVEIRVQDYRDVRDGPFDAISSIGMFEHVGLAKLREYFDDLHALLVPKGRLLNHGISNRPQRRPWVRRPGFISRYVFPDGELHEVGSVVTVMQQAGFEARHLEDLREHYALTLRAWVRNLEARWDEAVSIVGVARARIWRLYMAACVIGFETNTVQVNQVLAVKNDDEGRSGMPLRPTW